MAQQPQQYVQKSMVLRFVQIPADRALAVLEFSTKLESLRISCDAAYFIPALLRDGPAGFNLASSWSMVIPFPTFNECLKDNVPLFFFKRSENKGKQENIRAKQLLDLFSDKLSKRQNTFYGDVIVFWRRNVDERRHQMKLNDFTRTDLSRLLGPAAVLGLSNGSSTQRLSIPGNFNNHSATSETTAGVATNLNDGTSQTNSPCTNNNSVGNNLRTNSSTLVIKNTDHILTGQSQAESSTTGELSSWSSVPGNCHSTDNHPCTAQSTGSDERPSSQEGSHHISSVGVDIFESTGRSERDTSATGIVPHDLADPLTASHSKTTPPSPHQSIGNSKLFNTQNIGPNCTSGHTATLSNMLHSTNYILSASEGNDLPSESCRHYRRFNDLEGGGVDAAAMTIKHFIEMLSRELPIASTAMDHLLSTIVKQYPPLLNTGNTNDQVRLYELRNLLVESQANDRRYSAEVLKLSTELAHVTETNTQLHRENDSLKQDLLASQTQIHMCLEETARLVKELSLLRDDSSVLDREGGGYHHRPNSSLNEDVLNSKSEGIQSIITPFHSSHTHHTGSSVSLSGSPNKTSLSKRSSAQQQQPTTHSLFSQSTGTLGECDLNATASKFSTLSGGSSSVLLSGTTVSSSTCPFILNGFHCENNGTTTSIGQASSIAGRSDFSLINNTKPLQHFGRSFELPVTTATSPSIKTTRTATATTGFSAVPKVTTHHIDLSSTTTNEQQTRNTTGTIVTSPNSLTQHDEGECSTSTIAGGSSHISNVGKKWRVTQVYKPSDHGTNDQFAELNEGDIVTIEREDTSGWWWVSNGKPSGSGWYPFSFLQSIASQNS